MKPPALQLRGPVSSASLRFLSLAAALLCWCGLEWSYRPVAVEAPVAGVARGRGALVAPAPMGGWASAARDCDAAAGALAGAPAGGAAGGAAAAGGANGTDVLHVVFIALGPGLEPLIRQLVLDVIEHTGPRVVVHLVVRCGDGAVLRALAAAMPRHARLSLRWWDLDGFRSAAYETMCAGVLHGSAACVYLYKLVLHEILPPAVPAALFLDADMRLVGDVVERLLRDGLADLRSHGAVVGISANLAPTYARVGLGQGYNAGVLLLDLATMRSATPAGAAYRAFLADTPARIAALPRAVDLSGVLGLSEQTLLTVLNATTPLGTAPLIRTIPCECNENLYAYRACVASGAKERGFDTCAGSPLVVHGNGKLYHTLRLADFSDEALRGVTLDMRAACDAVRVKDRGGVEAAVTY